MPASTLGIKIFAVTWFETLFGFLETSGDHVRSQLQIQGEYLCSAANGKRWKHGNLEVLPLKALRERVDKLKLRAGPNIYQDLVGCTRTLHQQASNENALFQVASQFNLLEMISPRVTPEAGIGRYELDQTQGPTSAICTGASTAYRNYLLPIQGKPGQSKDRQLNCIDRLHKALLEVASPRDGDAFWSIENGYLFANANQLDQVSDILSKLSQVEMIALQGQLEFGFLQNASVTLAGATHCVSQFYCPSLPIGYNQSPIPRWEPLARLVLTALYEATLCAGVLNQHAFGSPNVYLTRVGDGVFETPLDWIEDAIQSALTRVPQCGLSVHMVNDRCAGASTLRNADPVA